MMRRLLSVVLGGLLLLSAFPATADITTTDLNALAEYYPADTVGFASIRTDQAYIDTLDVLFERVVTYLPASQRPPIGLTDLANSAVQIIGLTSVSELTDLLGATAAAGIWLDPDRGLNGDPRFLISAQVDNPADLIALIDVQTAQLVEADQLKRTDDDGTIIYTTTESFTGMPIAAAVTADALLLSQELAMLGLEGFDRTLASADDFSAAYARLPENEYNVGAYLNVTPVQDVIEGTPELADLPDVIDRINQATRPTVLGATLLDEDTLALDVATSVDRSVYEELGIVQPDSTPVDVDFARHVPADTPLVIFGTGLGQGLQASFDSLRNISAVISESGGLSAVIDPTGTLLATEERLAVDSLDPSLVIGAFSLPFAAGTGLSLERDVFPVIDGNAALYTRVIPTNPESQLAFLTPAILDFALVIETSNPDGTAAIVEQLGTAADLYDTPIPREAYGNGNALVFPTLEVAQFGTSNELDLLLGVSDDLFVFGTRTGATESLAPQAALSDNAAYQRAQTYFLTDASQVWYIGTEPILESLNFLAETGQLPLSTLADVYRAVSLIESSSITSSVSDGGSTAVIRAVITLSPEPRDLLEELDAE
jgi:hypothetical protein